MRHRNYAWIFVSLLAATCGGSEQTEIGVTEAALGGGGTPATSILVDTSVNQVGRLTSSGNSLVRSWNQYDTLGRSVAAQHVIGDTSYYYSNQYGYPRGGSGPGTVIVAATFPDSETVAFGYDAGGNQKSITATPAGGVAQTIVSKVVRNVRGQTVEVDYGNQTKQVHCYNDGSLCNNATTPNTNLRLTQIATSLSGTLQQYTYSFDRNGNITSVVDINGDATASYGYDSLDRLTTGTFAYGYDQIGNLTSKEGVTQTFFASGASSVHPHALSTVGSLSHSYDANGNLTSRSDGLTIAWNAENMPLRVSGGPTNTITNKYFLGESIWKKTQGGVTTYYLPGMRIENGSARKFYATFAERDAADRTSCSVNTGAGCLKFYHSDQIGSSTLVTSAAGSVVRRGSYKPYGEDRATPIAAFTPKYQFNFKEREQDGSGFYDYGARVYNPSTGIWLSADTHDGDGANRYAYVRNNPLRYTDPTGHDGEDTEVYKTNYVYRVEVHDHGRAYGVLGKAWNAVRTAWHAVDPDNTNQLPGFLPLEARIGFGVTASILHPAKTLDRTFGPMFVAFGCLIGMDCSRHETKVVAAWGVFNYVTMVGGNVVSNGLRAATPELTSLEIGSETSVGSELAGGTAQQTLYHYTSEAGKDGILESGEILASQGAKNARYGSGQYFTDIAPEAVGGQTLATTPAGQMSLGQLSSRLFKVPWNTSKLSSFLEIDVTGLGAREVAPNIWLVEGETGLNIGCRVVRSGSTLP